MTTSQNAALKKSVVFENPNDGPEAGSVWNGRTPVVDCPKRPGRVFFVETRHVVERMPDGQVVFITGRITPYAFREVISLAGWLFWVMEAKAKKVRG